MIGLEKSWVRLYPPLNKSLEAAPEYSPRRKPWVRGKFDKAP